MADSADDDACSTDSSSEGCRPQRRTTKRTRSVKTQEDAAGANADLVQECHEDTAAEGSESGGGGIVGGSGPPVQRVVWTSEEDQHLRKVVEQLGAKNWNLIASKMPQRTSKSCRSRWLNQLRPNVQTGGFTPQEDQIIIQTQAQLGNRWTAIAAALPGRTDNAVKNRWNGCLRKRTELMHAQLQQQQQLQQQDGQQQEAGKHHQSSLGCTSLQELHRLLSLGVPPHAQNPDSSFVPAAPPTSMAMVASGPPFQLPQATLGVQPNIDAVEATGVVAQPECNVLMKATDAIANVQPTVAQGTAPAVPAVAASEGPLSAPGADHTDLQQQQQLQQQQWQWQEMQQQWHLQQRQQQQVNQQQSQELQQQHEQQQQQQPLQQQQELHNQHRECQKLQQPQQLEQLQQQHDLQAALQHKLVQQQMRQHQPQPQHHEVQQQQLQEHQQQEQQQPLRRHWAEQPQQQQQQPPQEQQQQQQQHGSQQVSLEQLMTTRFGAALLQQQQHALPPSTMAMVACAPPPAMMTLHPTASSTLPAQPAASWQLPSALNPSHFQLASFIPGGSNSLPQQQLPQQHPASSGIHCQDNKAEGKCDVLPAGTSRVLGVPASEAVQASRPGLMPLQPPAVSGSVTHPHCFATPAATAAAIPDVAAGTYQQHQLAQLTTMQPCQPVIPPAATAATGSQQLVTTAETCIAQQHHFATAAAGQQGQLVTTATSSAAQQCQPVTTAATTRTSEQQIEAAPVQQQLSPDLTQLLLLQQQQLHQQQVVIKQLVMQLQGWDGAGRQQQQQQQQQAWGAAAQQQQQLQQQQTVIKQLATQLQGSTVGQHQQQQEQQNVELQPTASHTPPSTQLPQPAMATHVPALAVPGGQPSSRLVPNITTAATAGTAGQPGSSGGSSLVGMLGPAAGSSSSSGLAAILERVACGSGISSALGSVIAAGGNEALQHLLTLGMGTLMTAVGMRQNGQGNDSLAAGQLQAASQPSAPALVALLLGAQPEAVLGTQLPGSSLLQQQQQQKCGSSMASDPSPGASQALMGSPWGSMSDFAALFDASAAPRQAGDVSGVRQSPTNALLPGSPHLAGCSPTLLLANPDLDLDSSDAPGLRPLLGSDPALHPLPSVQPWAQGDSPPSLMGLLDIMSVNMH